MILVMMKKRPETNKLLTCLSPTDIIGLDVILERLDPKSDLSQFFHVIRKSLEQP